MHSQSNAGENANQMSAISSKVRFSSYTFDRQTGVLTRFGTRLRLEGQPAQVLAALLASPGDVVSREELIARLWPDEKVGEFDRRLDKAVAKLRAALNEKPVKPRYFETLKGRGYRFFAPVEVEVGSPPVATVDTNPIARDAAAYVPGQGKDEGSGVSPDLPDVGMGSTLREVDVGPGLQGTDGIVGRIQTTGRGLLSRIRFRNLAGVAALAAISILSVWIFGRFQANHRGHPTILVLGFRNSAAPTQDFWISRFISDWMAADLRLSSDVQVLFGSGTAGMRPWSSNECCANPSAAALREAVAVYDADMVLFGDYGISQGAAGPGQWSVTLCLVPTREGRRPIEISRSVSEDEVSKLLAEAGEQLRSAARFSGGVSGSGETRKRPGNGRFRGAMRVNHGA
jgi:DNA-binding winged helix-turn-helix (wHTH) protein